MLYAVKCNSCLISDHAAKKRVAELEIEQIVAFHHFKVAESKVAAVDAWHTRFNAAERVVTAYKSKLRLRANGGEGRQSNAFERLTKKHNAF